MKRLVKTVAVLMAAILLCMVAAACENTSDESQSGAGENSFNDKEGFYGYNIPDGIDYEGRTVGVLTLAQYQVKPEDNPEYSAEKVTAVISAASECTRKVEELLNVEVVEEGIDTGSRYGGPMYQRIVLDAMSYTSDYLFVMPALTEAAMLASDGILYDMNDIVDLNNPWWCKEFNDAVTIADKTYFISGDITTVSLASTMFVAFNKSIESKHELAKQYGYSSLYEMVDKKAWTQDVMFEMAKSVYVDENENLMADPDDTIGISAQTNIVYWLLRAGDINVCTLDDEGYPVLTVNHERALSLITDAQEYCQDPVSGLIIADDYMDTGLPVNPTVQTFIDGRGLFLFNALSAFDKLREMADDFGVLPCPIYGDDQDNYSNNVGAWTSNCICVPTSVAEEDLELVSHFLEALGAVSKSLLTPTYYEQTLQYQISRDDESMRMLDIINSTRSPDLSEMYRWGGMMSAIAEMRLQPVGTFVSAYETIETQTLKDIEETVNSFKEREH